MLEALGIIVLALIVSLLYSAASTEGRVLLKRVLRIKAVVVDRSPIIGPARSEEFHAGSGS